MTSIQIKGILIGRRIISGRKKAIPSDIIHIQEEFRPKGPAENSIVEILFTGNKAVASYIPWVGYFDLDREIKKDPTGWEIIEPGKKYLLNNVEWNPFR